MKQLYFHDKGAKENSVNWKCGKIEAKEPNQSFHSSSPNQKSFQYI